MLLYYKVGYPIGLETIRHNFIFLQWPLPSIMSKISLLSDLDFSEEHKMKNILATPNFNVARVCVPKGTVIPSHPEPNGTYFIVLQGSGVFSRGEETFELHKNESLFIDAGQHRGLTCLEDLVFLGIRDLDPENSAEN